MSRDDPTKRPQLHFFRATPKELTSRPPLASSLQSVESSFIFISHARFPHALVTCASAIESSIKAALRIPPTKKRTATWLYEKAAERWGSLESFDDRDLRQFRDTRNDIVHYGFSPRDDEKAAVLLLNIGFPFFEACNREFFGRGLVDSLAFDYGENLRVALSTYQKAKDRPNLQFARCFDAFAHLLRWSLRESLMPDWERNAVARAKSYGAPFESSEASKRKLDRIFGATWAFDCPICDEVNTFVCELDPDRLEEHTIRLERALCTNCNLVLKGMPFLAEALVGAPVETERMAILREYGYVGNHS